ncbi:MAG: AAA family ATPase [Firmicutes bacterium]|nr:AAA family ATPase [Bacillota bacterium]
MQIRLLGPPCVLLAGREVEMASIRAAALLWFLAAQPERLFARDELVALLWDDVGLEEGRNRLNTTLTRLRRSLPECPVHSERRVVGWDLKAKVTVDAAAFVRAVGELPAVGGEAEERRRLEEILSLRRGQFLEGFALDGAPVYEEWLSHQRLAWDRRSLDLWERLVRADAGALDWAAVRRHATAALQIDPWQEKFHRWTMLAHRQLGDRAAALTYFQRLARRLREELDADPDPETQALAEQIRRGTDHPDTASRSAHASVAVPASAPPPAEPSTAWELPWVGRSEELGRLERLLNPDSRAGVRLVVVDGPPGIGKTRLIREALGLRGGAPHRWATCYQTMQPLPYVPWITLLREEVRRRGVESVPGPWRRVLSGILPEVEGLGVSSLAAEGELGSGQRLICEAIVQYWGCVQEPMVVVLDDLHWADEASWTVLAMAMESDLLQQFTVVASVRREALPPVRRQHLERWRREAKAFIIPLGPLSAAEVDELVQRVRPGRERRWSEHLFRATKGQPLLLAELLRVAEESWESADGNGALASSVRQAVYEWLGHLSPAAQGLAEAMALFSAPVALEFLRQMAGVPEDTARLAWQELQRCGVIEEELRLGEKDWLCQRFPGVRGVLYHDLVRVVIQESMPRSQWVALHRRAVELGMEVAHQDVFDAGFLAYHAGEAGMWEEAARWSLSAADAAEKLGAYAEAVRWLEVAAEHLKRLPETTEHRRAWVNARLRLALLAWHTAPQQGMAAVEGLDFERSLPERGELRAVGWIRRMEGMMLGGRLNQAKAVLQRVAPWAERFGPSLLRGIVLLRLGQLRATAGELAASSQDFAACAPLLEAAPPPWYAECAGTWATVLAAMGAFDQALEVLKRLAQWAPGWHHPTVPIVATVHELTVHSQRGDWPRALEVGRRLFDGLRPQDHPALEYVGLIYMALPMAALGDLAGSVGLLHRAIDLGGRLGMRILRDRAWALLGEVLLAAGQGRQAMEAAGEGLRIAQEDGYRVGAGVNLRVLGSAQVAIGEREEGLGHLRQALEQLTFLQALPEVLWCHRRLAAVCEEPEATAHFRTGERMAQQMGMPWRAELGPAAW